MKLKQITKWSTIDKDGKISLNHIENGWSTYEKPQPIKEGFILQYRWDKDNGEREYAFLDENNKIIPVTGDM